MIERNFSRSFYYFEWLCAQSDRTLNHYDQAGDFLEGDATDAFQCVRWASNNGGAVRTHFTIYVSSSEADNSAAHWNPPLSCSWLLGNQEWTRLTARALCMYSRPNRQIVFHNEDTWNNSSHEFTVSMNITFLSHACNMAKVCNNFIPMKNNSTNKMKNGTEGYKDYRLEKYL